jgi:hypothetical protein
MQNRCHQNYEFEAQITVWNFSESGPQIGARNIRSKAFVRLTGVLSGTPPRIFSPTHILGFTCRTDVIRITSLNLKLQFGTFLRAILRMELGIFGQKHSLV